MILSHFVGLRQSHPAVSRIACAIAAIATASSTAHAQLTGETSAHDPSSLAKSGSTYYYFATGQGIAARTSSNKVNWSGAASVFSTPPAWTTAAVSGFTGDFWAPDLAFFNGKYHLYYSASSWGTIDSAIGVATSPTLAGAVWTDQGKVVQSDAAGQSGPNTDTTSYNAIDPSILVDDSTGRVWMSFGSYSSGILVTEINPATGKRLNTGSLSATLVANNTPGGGWGSSIEGSSLIKHGSFYYLVVNYGGCCAGVDSTYNIRVGRSTSPTGPFLDKSGVDMRSGGGAMFLDDDGNKIGPGHFSFFTDAGVDQFSYHYYDGNRNGAPTYGIHNLYWTADGWPSYSAINPNWTGTTNANWSAATNWSDAVPNAASAIANFKSISNGRYLISIDGSARTVGTINFDSTGSYIIGSTSGNGLTLDQADNNQATINVAAGSHVIGAPLTSLDQLGITVTPATSTLTLQGTVSAPSLQKYGSGNLSLAGANTYSGTALIHDGTLTVSNTMQSTGYVSVGAVTGDVAALRVISGGALSVQADLNIGDTGDAVTTASGSLELSGNGSINVTTGGFFVGAGFFANTRGDGVVNQSGGTLAVTNAADGMFVVGGRASLLATGVYNLSGGTINANTNVRVGGKGTGTINQTGGTFNTANFISIARLTGSNGTWAISGGTLNHTGAGTQIIVGEQGTGVLTIDGSALVTTPSAVRLGITGGNGTLNLNGGVLRTTQITRGTGTGTVNFDGGTLRAGVSTVSFVGGLSGAVVKAGGVTIDTNGFNVTIAQPLTHDASLAGIDGGVSKVGNGDLALTGTNSFTGALRVNAGSVRLGIAARNVLSNAGGVEINAGSLLIDANVGDSTATTVRNLLAASCLSGFQSGQIRSVAATTSQGLGWIQSSPTQVKISLVGYGDANLDTAVNFDDLLLLAQNYGVTSGAVWGQGDFNYDGAVGFDDLLLLAQQYAGSGASQESIMSLGENVAADWALARSLAPEPSALVFCAMFTRRRRGSKM